MISGPVDGQRGAMGYASPRPIKQEVMGESQVVIKSMVRIATTVAGRSATVRRIIPRSSEGAYRP